MSQELSHTDRRLFPRWLRATFLGWLLGFLLILAGSVIGDLVELGGGQFIVGIGMGAGVGYTQGRTLGQLGVAGKQWMWASAVGLGIPFIISDIIYAFWRAFSFSLAVLLANVVLAGLLVGLLQYRLLSSKSDKAIWWIPTCIAGWTLVAAGIGVVIGASAAIPGRWLEALVNITIILSGGVVLGAVTGGSLVWILGR
jgi:hypothetical protein